MNAQTQTSQILDLVNASIKAIEISNEEKAKVLVAAGKAEQAKRAAVEYNKVRKDAANQLVSEIQSTLAKELKDSDAVAQKTYHQEMVKLGLDSDKIPLQTALAYLDQASTIALASVGIAAKKVHNLFGSVKAKFNMGFKS